MTGMTPTFALVILASGFVQPVQSSLECESGWELIGDQCYQLNWQRVNYADALDHCEEEDATLAHPMDESTSDLLMTWVQGVLGDGLNIWLGLNDLDSHGIFVWEDDEDTVVDWVNWRAGNPNDNGKCVCVATDANSQWRDVSCTIRRMRSVCQKPATEEADFAATPELVCAAGWTYLDDKCYRQYSDLLTFHKAKGKCERISGHLAMVTSQTIDDKLAEIGDGRNSWIGMHDIDGDETFELIDGSAVSYVNWDVDEPHNHDGTEFCVVLRANGKWNDAYCKYNKPFFCEVDAEVKPETPTLTADASSPTDGDDIELTCTTTTTGVTEYRFKFGATSLVKSSSATYTISSATIGTDDGSYTCIAFSGIVPSDISNSHDVTLAPTLSASPSDATVESGTSVTCTCGTGASGAEYTFYHDSTEVYSGGDSEYVASLTSHSGTYTCVVTVSGVDSPASDGHSVSIVDAPETPTLRGDVSHHSMDGDDLELTCTTSTTGITEYEFVRGATSLVKSSSDTYTISSATIGTDNDSYTCIAYIDTVTSDTSSPYVLILYPQTPTLSASPSDATVDSGTSVTFTCDSASSADTYTFYQDSTVVSSGVDSEYVITASTAHSGSYTCVVTSSGVDSVASSAHAIFVEFVCSGSGHLADDTNECMFYHCSGSIAHHINCPSNTKWNQELTTCDHDTSGSCP